MIWILLLFPWVGVAAFVLFGVRFPRRLPATGAARDSPTVSVVVPARNEAVNVEACLRSLAGSTYPDFEIVVVDDGSDDGTGELARRVAAGRARRIRVIDGEPLPDGWLGKPWACWQGALEARGSLLLFTDADTRHAPDLLARAVACRTAERADVLTVVGRQVMGSFWERLVQPHVFCAMALRFRDLEGAIGAGRWRDVVANGQYLLFTREAYDAMGGHRAVGGEVVEDLALAQLAVRGGWRLVVRVAEDALATRMYRSLGELVRGWSKNVALGACRTVPPAMRPLVMPLSALGGAALWLSPPAILALSPLRVVPPAVGAWAAAAVGLSATLWAAAARRAGAPARYGLLYPLGASVVLWILARSWIRGRDVEWKGRRYRVAVAAEEVGG